MTHPWTCMWMMVSKPLEEILKKLLQKLQPQTPLQARHRPCPHRRVLVGWCVILSEGSWRFLTLNFKVPALCWVRQSISGPAPHGAFKAAALEAASPDASPSSSPSPPPQVRQLCSTRFMPCACVGDAFVADCQGKVGLSMTHDWSETAGACRGWDL